MPKTYHIDAKRRLIAGANRGSLLKRIRQEAFAEVDHGRRKNWRLFINDNFEMIWVRI